MYDPFLIEWYLLIFNKSWKHNSDHQWLIISIIIIIIIIIITL